MLSVEAYAKCKDQDWRAFPSIFGLEGAWNGDLRCLRQLVFKLDHVPIRTSQALVQLQSAI